MTAALELFAPVEVEKYELVKSDLARSKASVDALTIARREDAVRAHDGLADIKRVLLTIEETRKAQVGPLNDQVRAINATWKPLTEALSAMEAALKRKLLLWQQAERERVAREQEAARKAAEEASRREAEALAKAEAAKNSRAREAALAKARAATHALIAAREAEPMPAPTGFHTDAGTSSTRLVWAFKVTDPAQVPRDFLIVDEKAIRRAVAEGARNIPGVVIYEEEQLATRVVAGPSRF